MTCRRSQPSPFCLAKPGSGGPGIEIGFPPGFIPSLISKVGGEYQLPGAVATDFLVEGNNR